MTQYLLSVHGADEIYQDVDEDGTLVGGYDSKAAMDDLSADIDNDGDSEDMTDDHAEPAPFGSMRLLPPNPSWLDAPVFGQRSTLTPKQVFDTGRRSAERLDGPLPDAVTTRASALLRDVSIF